MKINENEDIHCFNCVFYDICRPEDPYFACDNFVFIYDHDTLTETDYETFLNYIYHKWHNDISDSKPNTTNGGTDMLLSNLQLQTCDDCTKKKQCICDDMGFHACSEFVSDYDSKEKLFLDTVDDMVYTKYMRPFADAMNRVRSEKESEEAMEPNSPWIRCKDRLPENDTAVLVVLDAAERIMMLDSGNAAWRWNGEVVPLDSIEWWAPLPDLPIRCQNSIDRYRGNFMDIFTSKEGTKHVYE